MNCSKEMKESLINGDKITIKLFYDCGAVYFHANRLTASYSRTADYCIKESEFDLNNQVQTAIKELTTKLSCEQP